MVLSFVFVDHCFFFGFRWTLTSALFDIKASLPVCSVQLPEVAPSDTDTTQSVEFSLDPTWAYPTFPSELIAFKMHEFGSDASPSVVSLG